MAAEVSLEYSGSRERRYLQRKRCLDVMLVAALWPALVGSEIATKRIIHRSDFPDLPTIYKQARIGQRRNTFTIQKLQTLRPGTQEPLDNWAAVMRRYGIDELAQLRNIQEGTMSCFGYRPLINDHYEEVMDNLTDPNLKETWPLVVSRYKPGGVNSYGIYNKFGEFPKLQLPPGLNDQEVRATLDIYDHTQFSLRYDMSLVARLTLAAVHSRGDIGTLD